jgi:hypothetical protein
VCAASCLEPTQVRLVLTADEPTCAQLADPKAPRVADIYVAPTPVEAEFTAVSTTGVGCSGGLVGDLVLVPAPDKTAAAVRVVVGVTKPTTQCNAADNYAGCIVARRRFTYTSHRSLSLPIHLGAGCVGKPCAEAGFGETCEPSQSQCISSLTAENDGGLEPGKVQAPDVR